MIPVQLTIQGLYSYQEKQTIDFTKLTAANLFGIFGTVGSGKSSILEAITFAIYGRTDRLNLSGDNRYYNMMNLKSNELLIDFVFETGKEQTAYRATVKGKRNGKNFEDVKALDRSAYRKKGNEWIPIATADLEQAIGLSYDNFKRTIIIPQGQFQEFLQLGNKDRTQMMKELFNLGKFEFYYKVTSLESKNNAQKQNIEGQLQQLGSVDPEQLKVFKSQLVQLENELKKQNAKLTEYQKTEEDLRKLQDLAKRKSEAEKAFKSLREQEPVFKQLEQKISRFEQCVIQFKHLLDGLKLTNEKVQVREKQIKQDEVKQKLQESEIGTLNKKIEELNPAYEKREELKQKAEELGRLIQMKTLEQTISIENGRLQKGTQVCNDYEKNLEQLKIQKQELEALIKFSKGKMPDLELLSAVKNWYTEKHLLEKELPAIQKELEENQKTTSSLQNSVAKLLEEAGLTQLPEIEYSNILQILKDKTGKAKEKQKALNEQESHIRVKEQLKAYSENMEDGAPCPLCGSVHHPDVLKTEDLNDTLLKLNVEKQANEKEQEQLSDWISRINLLSKQQEMIHQQKNSLLQKQKAQQERIEAHAKKFTWEKYRVETELEKAFQEARRIQGELKKQDDLLEKLGKDIDKKGNDFKRFQVEVDKIRTVLTVQQTELKTLEKQLRLIKAETYQEVKIEQIEIEKSKLQKEHSQLEKSFSEITQQITEKSKLRDTLFGSVQAGKKELEQEKQSLHKLRQQTKEQLEKSTYNSIDEVTAILSESFNPDTEKQRIAHFKDQFLQAKSLLQQLQKDVGERIYDQETHQKLNADIALLKEHLARKNQEQGKIAEQLKKLQKDLESQAALQKELEKLELRAENLKTIKSLFKASGFVNYISSVYLQNLCNAANDRFFQLTRQKLSLEITPDNNFQVRDFMNGGKIRSVKTLSGGQTFQAAMSLALALADNIQKITESKQNFFFLDEGFGSLDKESLGVVFDTLKSLRKENRIVGVISHVEEMQQEIDVHLRIDNQEERGSQIWTSWME
ncbi:exonuclease SbcC [Draconibacterium orientale]|uniref:Chromosome segregation protein SMC n=1 Tax=Draconibacterium orientale TaxID=1168034 RepID=X5DJB8_9BACT|nr:SMC family ATPase [Draconibacterium orientale]AHW60637.1 chromosome segregation protein SMC [Draconibacterium orientale]SET79462.1 exonuclease SbcC [Draconibacterium orientale]